MLISKNKKAYFDFEVIEEFEAGLVLVGTEIKSIRDSSCNFEGAFADISSEAGTEEIMLHGLYIAPYKHAGNRANHEPTRTRKILLHKREIKKMIGKIKQKGLTLIPLDLHYNKKGFVKVKLGLCKGKTKGDKRATIKDREWKISKNRIIKESR
jgi:SsrA-binding protein